MPNLIINEGKTWSFKLDTSGEIKWPDTYFLLPLNEPKSTVLFLMLTDWGGFLLVTNKWGHLPAVAVNVTLLSVKYLSN